MMNQTSNVQSNEIVRVEYANGDVVYRVPRLGWLHNDRGPAIIAKDGKLEWWLMGRKYPFESWVELASVPDSIVTFLRLKYIIK